MRNSKRSSKASTQTGKMRVLDKTPKISRRGFLGVSGLAAIGVTVLSTSTLVLSPREALAQRFGTLGPDVGKTLLQMARDIFPHDKLAETYYLTALEPYDAAAAKDPALKTLLSEGVAGLDASARQRFGKTYAEVAKEEDRVTLLKAIEATPLFQKIRGGLVTGLYNNKAVWPLLGYEGSSWEKGGYLNRGFNDIDWL